VWVVACLGIASGFGYYALTLLGLVFIFVTLTIVENLQHRFINSSGSEETYVLESQDIATALNQIHTLAQVQHVMILDLSAQQTQDGHRISFRVIFTGRRHKKHHNRFFTALVAIPGVHSVRGGTEVTV
jgi:uncharacterized membrane protein YhiD involved in acid resistance